MENQQPEEHLSAEELTARKEELFKFYTDSMPYINAQYEYEKKLMELDEVRFKRTQIQIQMAMMMNPELSKEAEEEDDLSMNQESVKQQAPQGRKLKKA
jgi:hypothetical protein